MIKTTMAGVLACMIGLVAQAPAKAEVTLKLGWTTSDSPLDPYAVGAHLFKAEVENASNKQIVVQLYPNRQLGDEKQMLEGLRFGTVDVALATNSVVAQLEPGFQLFDLPFLFSDSQQAYKVLDSEIGKAMGAKLEPKGIVLLGYTEGGFRQMLNNKKPVETPADIHGVKYRVMQNPVFIEMFSRLGGSAVPMAWGETFTAVQQGTIDGLEGAVSVFYASKFQEVTKYLSLTNHNYSAVELLISARSLKKLTPEQQTMVREAASRAVAAQRKAAGELAVKALDLIKKDGVQVNDIANVAPFREAVAPIYDKARSVVGSELLDRTLAMVK
ncbi:TRAP transporter substrate-binding protein [Bosea sp. TWI1241]|uniref:TRAP transporter substrate-binding protein n=1 Tax=Bosea sp. TWI1241 TaxID=3148904 RepID=UPI003209B37C